MSKLPALTPDDPLRGPVATTPPPAQTSAPAVSEPTAPAAALAPDAEPTSPHAAPSGFTPAPTTPKRAQAKPAEPTSVDAEWNGTTDVTTARVPTEVLRLMRQRSRELGLPIGMLLTAGLLDVLALDDDDLIERIEATQLRYDRARRRASRAG